MTYLHLRKNLKIMCLELLIVHKMHLMPLYTVRRFNKGTGRLWTCFTVQGVSTLHSGSGVQHFICFCRNQITSRDNESHPLDTDGLIYSITLNTIFLCSISTLSSKLRLYGLPQLGSGFNYCLKRSRFPFLIRPDRFSSPCTLPLSGSFIGGKTAGACISLLSI